MKELHAKFLRGDAQGNSFALLIAAPMHKIILSFRVLCVIRERLSFQFNLCRRKAAEWMFFMFFTILATTVLVALDQFTKYLATIYLEPVGTMPFIPGVLELRFVLNDGAAFSILSGNRWFLVVFTGLALVALAAYLCFKKPQSRVEYISLILILAGGIGNLIDRVRSGVVVDFFATTFMNFAVFNIADCFVCVGVALFFGFVVMDEWKKSKAKKQEDSHDKA